MLRENKNVRQIDGGPPRRWFAGKDIDLIVWLGEAEEVLGF